MGRKLADLAGLPFLDADHELERREGRRIAEIFRDDGESAFREIEARVIASLAELQPSVIATGGGAILRPDNREAIQRTGLAVWLDAPTDELQRRLSAIHQADARPSLTGSGTIAEIASVLERRIPLYRQTAHQTVDATATPDLIAERVLHLWRGAEIIRRDAGLRRDASL